MHFAINPMYGPFLSLEIDSQGVALSQPCLRVSVESERRGQEGSPPEGQVAGAAPKGKAEGLKGRCRAMGERDTGHESEANRMFGQVFTGQVISSETVSTLRAHCTKESLQRHRWGCKMGTSDSEMVMHCSSQLTRHRAACQATKPQ